MLHPNAHVRLYEMKSNVIQGGEEKRRLPTPSVSLLLALNDGGTDDVATLAAKRL